MANPNTAAVGPTFSPAGDSLLFGVSDPVASQGHLVAHDLESGDETILATLPGEAMPFHYNPGEAIVVSPDGIAFVRTDFFEAYLIRLPDEHLVGSDSH